MYVLLPLEFDSDTYESDNLFKRVRLMIKNKADISVLTPREKDNLFHLCVCGKNFRENTNTTTC